MNTQTSATPTALHRQLQGDRLGVPVYGIVGELGVGGLAIALAAQPTVENLIGGLSLYADKPIRVGDFCKYGDAVGTVEAIGIRSARIRGVDRADLAETLAIVRHLIAKPEPAALAGIEALRGRASGTVAYEVDRRRTHVTGDVARMQASGRYRGVLCRSK